MRPVCFLGTGRFAAACLEAIIGVWPVELVVSLKDDVLLSVAADRKIPANTIESKQGLNALSMIDEDWILACVNFKYLLPDPLLAQCQFRAVNLHSSILPSYKGFAPVSWAIINGEKRIGVTAHYIDSSIDGGNILVQKVRNLAGTETVNDALSWLYRVYPGTLVDALDMVERGEKGDRQPANDSYWPRRRPEDGQIDWCWPVQKVHNWIRALTRPYPGAFTFLGKGCRVMVYRAHPVEIDALPVQPSGTILSAGSGFFIVQCGKGTLKVLEWQLDSAEFLTESKTIRPGLVFE